LAFAVPFFISGPQLLTGTIVSCLLFLSTKYTSKKTSIIIAIVPSIGALLNGLVFGKFTPFLAYFLPLIWIGNLILINVYRKIYNSLFGILVSSLLKSIFLFLFAFVFFKLQIVPQIFLTAMGVFQFATAIMGGVVFLSIYKILNFKS